MVRITVNAPYLGYELFKCSFCGTGRNPCYLITNCTPDKCIIEDPLARCEWKKVELIAKHG